MTEETASNETSAACKAASTNDVIDVAVIGAGPAGLTAGLYAARAGLNVVLFERISPGGQLAQTEHMENYPGFPEGTGGFELAFAMKQQADRFGASNVGEEVVSVDFTQNPKVLTTAFNEYRAKSVIVATGARPRKLGLELEEDLQGRGVSYCATCDGNFFRDKEVMVVGGGNTAAGDPPSTCRASARRCISCTGATSCAPRPSTTSAWRTCRTSSSCGTPCLRELVADEGKLAGVRLEMLETGEERDIAVDGLFVAVGTEPNTEFLGGALQCDETGYIVADESCATEVPGVFAAGDVRTKFLHQVVTAVSDGAVCAEEAAEYLAI